MKVFTVSASLGIVVASSSAAFFDWENLSTGQQASVSQSNEGLTATGTGVGGNITAFVMGTNPGFESFGTRSLIGASDGVNRVAVKFSFSSLVTSVSAQVGDAATDDDGTITLAAYDSSDNLIDSDSFAYGSSVLPITLSVGAANIAYVIGTTDAGVGVNAHTVVWDNVSATPVPEPATMATLAIGATILLRRRKK